MAFPELKTLKRIAAASIPAAWCKPVGAVCGPFRLREGRSHVIAAGHGLN
jgi:hypothetical protein